MVASGSPSPPFTYNGKSYHCGQANNMYLFPGIALGGLLGGTRTISDNMIMAAAERLPSLVHEEDLAAGNVYPRLKVGAGPGGRAGGSIIRGQRLFGGRGLSRGGAGGGHCSVVDNVGAVRGGIALG